MPRRGKRDPERERFWRRTMKAWARSGQSIRGFCAEHELTETAFYAWRGELRKRDGERGGRGRRAGTPGTRSRTPSTGAARRPPSRPSFLPVRVTSSPAPIEIERNGTTIRLHGAVDPEALAGVLEAVHRASC